MEGVEHSHLSKTFKLSLLGLTAIGLISGAVGSCQLQKEMRAAGEHHSVPDTSKQPAAAADAHPNKEPRPAEAPKAEESSGLTTVDDAISSVYEAFQIPANHAHFTEDAKAKFNHWLRISLLIGIMIALMLAYGAYGYLFPEDLAWFRLWRLWLEEKKRHVVICGLNERALLLVESLVDDDKTVAVIEKDGENHLLEHCRAAGAFVFIGDATDDKILSKARVEFSAHAVAFRELDGANMDIADSLKSYLKDKAPAGTPPICHVHVSDFELYNWLRENHALTLLDNKHTAKEERGLQFQVRPFDSYDIAARLLFHQYPLDYKHIGPASRQRVHLIIFGFGQMGQALLLQAARIGHFANFRKIRVTVVDQKANEKKNAFLVRYWQIDKVCHVHFVECKAHETRVADDLKKWCEYKDTLTTVAVCFDNDTAGLSFALTLRRITEPLNVPTRVRMSAKSGLSKVLLAKDAEHGAEHAHAGACSRALNPLFTPFGMYEDCCHHNILLDDELNTLAMKAHEAYYAMKKFEKPDHPSVKRWNELEWFKQDSNIQQSMHIQTKLNAIKCMMLDTHAHTDPAQVAPHAVEAFDETAEIPLLAKMEHMRWNAERYLGGWTCCGEDERDDDAKKTPYLKPWEELTEAEQGWDKDPVSKMPQILKSIGRAIYRRREQ